MPEHPFIIVIGASAGGIAPLSELMSQLEPDINAAIFIVLHLSNTGIGTLLKDKIQSVSSLPCTIAANAVPIQKGHVYIAPPDYHLIVKETTMLIKSGPPESRWRPSIDILLRSAAVTHTEKVIGIILTGLLDDGTSGMVAISKCGGTTIVQDPEEAQFPDMPLSVLQAIDVSHVSKLEGMGRLIKNVIKTKVLKKASVPYDLRMEAEIAERTASGITDTMQLGKHTVYSCPGCGGGLWERKENELLTYRCYIGHKYTEPELYRQQNQKLETALWISVRMMEEKRNLLLKLRDQDRTKGFTKLSADYMERAREFEEHIKTMKSLLFFLHDSLSPS
ncbi:chemotaxis protein CheB [Flavitalea sp.]|nr:chemotaxis protein CheB [Flavitalea sp.]